MLYRVRSLKASAFHLNSILPSFLHFLRDGGIVTLYIINEF
jgi:hypothetical protein